jgi:spore germination protein
LNSKNLKRNLAATLLCALILAPSTAHAQSAAPASGKQVMAYLESSGSLASLTAFSEYINQLPTDTFAVDAHGNVTGNVPVQALEFARSKGMATFATVSNFDAEGFDPKITHAILNHPEVESRTIAGLLKVVEASSYTGVNIDFESISFEDRAAFTACVHEVAQKMRAAGHLTVVSVPAEQRDNPRDSWSGAFDYAALGKDADILQVMTYDEHGPWSVPGPVAGLDWVQPCIAFAASVVDPKKLSLGIPAYGYDWNLTKKTGAQIFWKDIPALIASSGATPQWDSAASSPYFKYQASDGSSHVVWYEDKNSIPLKSALAVTYNLAGVSVFALGYDDLSFWKALRAGGF